MTSRQLYMQSTGTLCALVMASSASAQVATVQVPMRDGVKLATDVYRDRAAKEAPVVLVRTPYDRTRQKDLGERWAKAGYIFVALARSWQPETAAELRDAVDAVATSRPYSSRKSPSASRHGIAPSSRNHRCSVTS